MLRMNDLKPGVVIEFKNEPFEVLASRHSKIAKGRPVMQTKLKSIKTGKVLDHTFRPSDKIPVPDIKKYEAKFLYRTRDEFFFEAEDGTPFRFGEDFLGPKINFLKKGIKVTITIFEGQPISVALPIKIVLEVKSAPPGERGDTAQGGTKDVTLETGATVKTPLFVKQGDKIEVNTQTGEYVRRANE